MMLTGSMEKLLVAQSKEMRAFMEPECYST
jgi:hypothetical protein